MKRKTTYWITGILLLLQLHAAHAQYISIPDPAFESWLVNNGYGTCMSGNQLDTTCPLVTSATTIDIAGQSISDITGITYFDNLSTLKCDHNLLTFLPDLPQQLSILHCSGNSLTALPTLPSSLIELAGNNNQLNVIPSLPPGLTVLECSNNQVAALPPLPLGLLTLRCNSNLLSSLPALPGQLIRLYTQDNQINSLPVLPPSLVVLDCGNNPLSSIPAIPASLTSLYCYGDMLTSLPALSWLDTLSCFNNMLTFLPALPDTLHCLDCSINQIVTLPDLPPTLHHLLCSQNQLVSLPSTLPANLVLDADSNPSLTCLPVAHIAELYWSNTGIHCRPWEFIADLSVPPVDTLPLCLPGNSGNCDIFWNIKGSVYADSIVNCQLDAGEPMLPNVRMNLYKNSVLVQQVYSNFSGQYGFDIDSGTYVTTVDTAGVPYIVSCPVAGAYTDTITAANPFHFQKDFSLECKPGFDIEVFGVAAPDGSLLPGNTSRICINIDETADRFNLHCAAGISGMIDIVKHGSITVDSIPASSWTPFMSGDTIRYAVTDFDSVEMNQSFCFYIHVDSTALVGDEVCFDIAASSQPGDRDTLNNRLLSCLLIANSPVANSKAVTPPGGINPVPTWLTYTVYFQNTGIAPSANVVILDTLDAHVDEGSLQLLSYSYEPLLQATGNVLRFSFAGINLPDSSLDEAGSHGFVQYRVRSKPGIPLHTVIHNTAWIFFDTDVPVATNTTSNLVDFPAALSEAVHRGELLIYPNPAPANATIHLSADAAMKKGGVISLTDMTGRMLYSVHLASGMQEIKLPWLEEGVYSCTFSNDAMHISKLLVVYR